MIRSTTDASTSEVQTGRLGSWQPPYPTERRGRLHVWLLVIAVGEALSSARSCSAGATRAAALHAAAGQAVTDALCATLSLHAAGEVAGDVSACFCLLFIEGGPGSRAALSEIVPSTPSAGVPAPVSALPATAAAVVRADSIFAALAGASGGGKGADSGAAALAGAGGGGKGAALAAAALAAAGGGGKGAALAAAALAGAGGGGKGANSVAAALAGAGGGGKGADSVAAA
ncbi:hypothetical protein HaLaN_25605, partial [Haematococcus lacustris]